MSDFTVVPLPPQTDLEFLTARVTRLLQDQAHGMFDIGTELLHAKTLLPHGEFSNWVETQLGIRIRTAQRFMSVARLASESDTLTHFPAGVLYELAAPSTPKEIVERVLQGRLAPTLDAIRNAKATPSAKPIPNYPSTPPPDPFQAARQLAFALADFLDTVAFEAEVAAVYLIAAFDDAFGEHDLWIEFLTDLGDATVTASHKTSEARMSP